MKTVLITGVNRGIGKALAETFLKNGDYVIGTSLQEIDKAPQENFKIFPLDLREAKNIESCAASIAALGKKIDVHINNAGTLIDDEETSVVIEKLRTTLEVNLIGTIDFTERIIPLLSGDAHIINISSQAGSLSDMENFEHSHAPFRYPAYKISKAALNMYTLTLALRFKNEGASTIASSVHPGWVRTEMGGDEAPILPEEAAQDIFKLANSKVQSGQFWFQGKKFPW